MIDFDIHINFRSKKTLVAQLSEEIRRLIEQGTLQAGDQLPPVRDLAAKLQVNFNTVARAYRHLDMKELITTQQGRGTFILQKDIRSPASTHFSDEAFKRDLNAFLLSQSQRTGLPFKTIRELSLERIQSIVDSTGQIRKNKAKKANRKPRERSNTFHPLAVRKISLGRRRMTREHKVRK